MSTSSMPSLIPVTTSRCASTEALVPLASNQAECPKQDDVEYLEIAASDAADSGECNKNRPSSWLTNCREQHKNDYLQPSNANNDYLQPSNANNDYLQPSNANNDYLQPSNANDDYLQPSNANNDYLQLLNANDDYLQPSNANNDYLQLLNANDDYLRPQNANDDYRQLVTNDDYLQQVAVYFSDNVTSSCNVSDSAQAAPSKIAQAMSAYATIAESLNDTSAPTVYSEITDDPSAPTVYSEITDDPSAPTVYSEFTEDPSAPTVYSEFTEDPSAPTVYSEFNLSEIDSDIVTVPSTLGSSFTFDMEESDLTLRSRTRKLPLKQLGAVVTLVIVILVMPAACVWLMLRIFLLPSNPASANRVTVAFCAIRHRPLGDSLNGLIDFDAVNINEGSAFDRSRLSVRQRSYYWLAASAELGTDKQSSLLLQHQKNSIRAATVQQYGFSVLNQQLNLSVSLFDIRLLDTGDTVHLTSKHHFDVNSVANKPTASFLGFSINGIFDQLVARKYEVDNTMTQRMTAIDGASVHHTVSKVANAKVAGTGWYIITLQVPVSGVYLMTTSIHCTTRNHVNSTAAERNKKMIFFRCRSESNSSTSIVNPIAGLTLIPSNRDFDVHLQHINLVSSTSTLVNLTANNDLFVFLDVAGSPDVSLVRYAVQLVLYTPVNIDGKVAWSVLSSSLSNGAFRNIIIAINEGGAYNNVSNSVIIPVTGVYYLMLTVTAPVTLPSRHRVMLNSNTIALEDRRGSTVSSVTDFVTTDKSVMLSLANDDVLTYNSLKLDNFIRVVPFALRFSGFLLYPK